MIVVGGGSSTRFGADKLMVEVAGRPVISHTIASVIDHVDICVVVCRPEILDRVARLHPQVTVVEGGPSRTRSEIAGLAAIGDEADLIGIHDAARPLVSPETISPLFEAAHRSGGAVPLVEHRRLVIDRETGEPLEGVHGAQTPQVFRARELIAAYARAAAEGFEGHDTVEVVERFARVRIEAVGGDPSNLKVTFPGDLDRVREALEGPSRT